MTTTWKHAIVRVDAEPDVINTTVVQRMEHGWLLDSQASSPETGTVDLTFRRAFLVPAAAPASELPAL